MSLSLVKFKLIPRHAFPEAEDEVSWLVSDSKLGTYCSTLTGGLSGCVHIDSEAWLSPDYA